MSLPPPCTQCESFGYDDILDEKQSFLVADPSVRCSDGDVSDSEHARLQAAFWVLFIVWPVAVPCSCLLLLSSISHRLKTRSSTPLVTASRFLWRDYKPDLWYWEVVDMVRKTFLTCFVFFIDTNEGSTRLMRLTR